MWAARDDVRGRTMSSLFESGVTSGSISPFSLAPSPANIEEGCGRGRPLAILSDLLLLAGYTLLNRTLPNQNLL